MTSFWGPFIILVLLIPQLANGFEIRGPECGATCLYVVLRAQGHGPETYQETLSVLGKPSKRGHSIEQLREAAKKFGLEAESVSLTKEALKQLPDDIEVILHLTKEHFIIVKSIDKEKGQMTLFDPFGGIARNVEIDNFDDWSGNALLLSTKPIELSDGEGWQPYFLSILLFVLGVGSCLSSNISLEQPTNVNTRNTLGQYF